MRTAFVSTAWLNSVSRLQTNRTQTQMSQLTQEISSGRMADVGLQLGTVTANSIALRSQDSSLGALIDSNAMVSAQLDQSQTVLTGLAADGNDLLKNLVGSTGDTASANLLQQQASGFLNSFTSSLNTSSGGRYLFGGIDTASPPVHDFASGPKAAIDAAFAAKFGLALPDPQNDPAAAQISGPAMKSFLDNEFQQLFTDPAWKTDWSSAASQNTTSRISPTEDLTVSVSADDPAMRKLAMAYSMVADLGIGSLGTDARKALIAKATEVLGGGLSDLTAAQARLGFAQGRVTAATTAMTNQKALVEQRIGTLEGVDPATAKTQLDTLSTELEMSYSMTVKLSSLSILNYV